MKGGRPIEVLPPDVSAHSGASRLSVRTWRDAGHGVGSAWHLLIGWKFVLAGLTVCLITVFGSLWLGRDVVVGGTVEAPYLLRHLLADGADIALKLGAVFAGILGIYRYWYLRYEPLVYFVVCSTLPTTILEDLLRDNPTFRSVCKRERLNLPAQPKDEDWERVHNLPIILFHDTSKDSLGISEGSTVDLRFDTPDGKVIWTIAFAFSFESITSRSADYTYWPVALTLSLRRYFRMERPFHDPSENGRTKERKPPEGWQRVEVYPKGFARLHGTTEQEGKLLWIACDQYSVRFRDPHTRDKFFEDDDKDDDRFLEYVGISLRVYRRSAFRYRASE